MSNTTPPPYNDVTGIFTVNDKHQDISRVQYNGSAKPGQLVVDTVNYSLWVGNADGNLNAVAGGGSGSPSGPVSAVQFNDSGAFGGDAAFTFDQINGLVSIQDLEITGNITSHLLPDANITYDLGSPTQRWKDLWLSNTTIHMGDQSISANSTGIQLSGGMVFPDGTVQTTAYITEPTEPPYRGFYAGVNRFWGTDPSINQIVFSNATSAPTYENLTTDTDEDDFAVSGLSSASIVVMLNVYGASENQAFTVDQLRVIAEAFIDNVLYDGETPVTDAATAKDRFYANWNSVFDSIAGDFYQNFEFYTPTTFDSQVATGGTGVDFTPVLRNGTTIYRPDGYNNTGTGYTVGDILTVPGDLYGGTTPENDAIITVVDVDGNGSVMTYTVEGSPINEWPTESIGDGGSDQYDTGNFIRTSVSDPTNIPYNGGDVSSDSQYWGGSSEYTVVYENSTWAMMAFNTAVEACRYAGNTGADGGGSKQVGNLIGGNSSDPTVDIGDFVFSGKTMSILGEDDMNIRAERDINIQADDDLFLEAQGDDVHIRAKNDVRVISNYPYGQESMPITWTFSDQGNIIFPDDTVQNTAWTGTLIQIVNGTSRVSVPNDSLQVEIQASANTWSFQPNGSLSTPVITVADLGFQPSGTRAFVSDSTLSAVGNFGEQVVGGGSNVVPVWSDGTTWFIG